MDGHDPRKAIGGHEAAKMQFHVRWRRHSREFCLRGLQMHHWQAEPKPPLKRVGGAARQHRQAGIDESIPDDGAHLGDIGFEGSDAGSGQNRRSSCSGTGGERAVERRPINHGRDRHTARVWHSQAGRRDEPCGCECVQCGLAWEIELVKAFRGENAGAVGRITDAIVLLANQHVGAIFRETLGSKEPGRPGADHEDIDRQMGHATRHYRVVSSDWPEARCSALAFPIGRAR